MMRSQSPFSVLTQINDAFNQKSIKAHVKYHLEQLLNTVALPADALAKQFPRVQASVLNYGIPDFSGTKGPDLDTVRLKKQVETAIKRFENRIDSNSLHVEITRRGDVEHANCLHLSIHAELRPEVSSDDVIDLSVFVDLERGLPINSLQERG